MFEIYSSLSGTQIAVLIISAILVGINKTAVPGLGVIPVMLLASTFETRLSTGLQLGMIAICDLMAVAWYRKGADWKFILRLIPWALAGLVVGSGILRLIPLDNDTLMRRLIGAIVLGLAIISFVKSHLNPDKIPSGTGAAAFFGILMGTTTQLANAAGPVSSIYLLAMKFDKAKYMGTAAWFFLIVNWIKVPIFTFEGRITMQSVLIDLSLIPVMVFGAVLGILLFRKIPQKVFDGIIQAFVIVAAVKMLFF
ncbi:MAG: sulfite exporter TauE/SafE family protein [Lentisphaeria bacterium]|nr:sulfite exporter TauE/SafE family protein [Lentisphaeria bacterium]